MENYGLKPRDAIHVSSMLGNNVSAIITQDPDFKGVKRIRL
jgi:predicted nucleic acid-binding protein